MNFIFFKDCKYRLLPSALLLLLFLRSNSAGVTVTTAKTVAVNFYKTTATYSPHSISATLVYTKFSSAGAPSFYAFNINPNAGFVIVSADDRVLPVLAYSTESSFQVLAGSAGINVWMDHMSAAVSYVVNQSLSPGTRNTVLWQAYINGTTPATLRSTGVSPLLTTTWNQENSTSNPPPYSYNIFCPNNGSDNLRCLTGCVATAMAQIMNYWKYPAHGDSSFSYNDSRSAGYIYNYGVQSADFANTNYNWAAMPASLATSSEASADTAVSLLMYQCGVSVGMNYGDDLQGGSGAFVTQLEAGPGKPCAERAYKTFFSYNPASLQAVSSSGFDLPDWIDLIEDELEAGRPVQYIGYDSAAGAHSWVCDGYDENNYLHMNWGWGGLADGYFSAGNLNPESYDFNFDDGALIGIEPLPAFHVSAIATSSTICAGNSTSINAVGPASANYRWSPVAGLSCPTCAYTVARPATTTTYTVQADSSGFVVTASVTVNVRPGLNFEGNQITNVSCKGLSDGAITIAVGGGIPFYSYRWNDGRTTATIEHLTAGAYSVTVNDAASCSVSTTQTITQPPALSASTTTTNGNCGESNGIISARAAGGTPGYSFLWSTGDTSSSISGLNSGTYQVTISDSNHCDIVVHATVVVPGSFYANLTPASATCYDSSSGGIQTILDSAVAPISYHWSNGATAANLTGVPAGNYAVTITDATGCRQVFTKQVSQPPALLAVATPTEAECGEATGAVLASATGGSSGYSYRWNTGATSAVISRLVPGTYTVTVHDINNCSISAQAAVIGLGTFVSNFSATDIKCYGDSTGILVATIGSGGVSPFRYHWANGSTANELYNLAAGNYPVTITDASGCAETFSESVSQSPLLSIAATAVFSGCSPTIANIATNPSGGTANYNYRWNTGDTTSALSNIQAGLYEVTLTDANYCSTTADINLVFPAPLLLNSATQPATCYGEQNGVATVNVSGSISPYSYSWSNGDTLATATGLSAGLYAVTVKDNLGCTATVSASVVQPDSLWVALTASNVLCGVDGGNISANSVGGTPSYSYLWNLGDSISTISNAGPGNYSVIVTDQNGCSASSQAAIALTGALTLAVQSNNATCYGDSNGLIAVTSTGFPPFSYGWNTFSGSDTAKNLIAGNYTVLVTDSFGCTVSAEITISQPDSFNIQTQATNSTGQDNGTASVAIINGPPAPYLFSWNNGDTTQDISNLAPGEYIVTVSTAAGCFQTGSVTVRLNNATGIADRNAGGSMNIYPNPASNEVLVNSENLSGYDRILLQNVLGQTLLNVPITANVNRLNVSNLANGAYYISLTGQNKSVAQQVIVGH